MSAWLISGIVGCVLVPFVVLFIWLKKNAPALRAATNAEGWVAECRACKAVNPAGDCGIIRVKAAGTKVTLARCAACGARGLMTVRKRTS